MYVFEDEEEQADFWREECRDMDAVDDDEEDSNDD